MKKVFKDRHDYIKEYCTDKKVLHLGCIGTAYKDNNKFNPWLHDVINSVAKECVGIDMNDEGRAAIAKARPDMDILFGDVTELDLEEKFDVIVAGEIIEHITNLDGFFESIKRHMHTDSIVIITTPNPFRLGNILDCFIRRNTRSQSSDHVMYYDVWTMRVLFERFDLEIDQYYFNTELAVQRIRNTIIRTVGFFWPIFHMNLMVVGKINKKS